MQVTVDKEVFTKFDFVRLIDRSETWQVLEFFYAPLPSSELIDQLPSQRLRHDTRRALGLPSDSDADGHACSDDSDYSPSSGSRNDGDDQYSEDIENNADGSGQDGGGSESDESGESDESDESDESGDGGERGERSQSSQSSDSSEGSEWSGGGREGLDDDPDRDDRCRCGGGKRGHHPNLP